MMAKLKDNMQILSVLTWKRLVNLVALQTSYALSKISKRSIMLGLPFSVSIEPTTACNLSCPECPSGLKQFSRATGKLTTDSNRKLLDSIGSQIFYINYYFQGEPFLNPQFLDLIRDAKKRKIYTATSTNAHFIGQKKAEEIVLSGLDRLIISIDGTTQASYESYRIDGKLEKVLAASRELVAAKRKFKSRTPHLIFQFLVVKHNEQQIDTVYSLAREIGIDEVRLKSAQVYDYKHGNPLIPENEKYARYKKKKDGTYTLKYRTGNHCWRMWSSCVLTWDAQVVPCCFDKDAHYTLGNGLDRPLKEIWKTEKYSAFRQQILTDRSKIDICTNCSEGSKVWL